MELLSMPYSEVMSLPVYERKFFLGIKLKKFEKLSEEQENKRKTNRVKR